MNDVIQQLMGGQAQPKSPMPPQPSNGIWSKVPQQGPPGPPPQGPPGPPSQPPPPGVNPQAAAQPPMGTPNLIPSGPQGQPNSGLIAALLNRR